MTLKNKELYSCIERHLNESAAVKIDAISQCSDAIVRAAQLMSETLKSGGKLLLCGNGGSAADCQHLAAEFVNLLSVDVMRPALAAIALTTDTSFLTAFSNDFGFEGVFERQVQALGKAGDTLIGISTSGASQNVIRAIRAARALNMHTIILMGSNGVLAEEADVAIRVPNVNTQLIQEACLTIEHILCDLVERELFIVSDFNGKTIIGPSTQAMFAQKTADANTKVRACVPVLVRDKHGAILLEKRSDCALWGMPGGKIEPGESIIDTAMREMREETGLNIKVTRLLGVYSGPTDRIVAFPDNVVQIVDILVEAEIISGKLTCSSESLALKFFAPLALPLEDEIIPAARLVLKDILTGNVGVIR